MSNPIDAIVKLNIPGPSRSLDISDTRSRRFGTSFQLHPFKIIANGGKIVINKGLVIYCHATGIVRFTASTTVLSGTDTTIYLQITGSTTDYVFTPDGAYIIASTTVPTDDDDNKFTEIGTVSGPGKVTQSLFENFFFKRRTIIPTIECSPHISISEFYIIPNDQPGRFVYYWAGIYTSSADMDDLLYDAGYPCDNAALIHYLMYLCDAIDLSGEPEDRGLLVKAAFLDAFETFWGTPYAGDDFVVHEAYLINAVEETEIYEHIIERRYRRSVSPYTPEDLTALEAKFVYI